MIAALRILRYKCPKLKVGLFRRSIGKGKTMTAQNCHTNNLWKLRHNRWKVIGLCLKKSENVTARGGGEKLTNFIFRCFLAVVSWFLHISKIALFKFARRQAHSCQIWCKSVERMRFIGERKTSKSWQIAQGIGSKNGSILKPDHYQVSKQASMTCHPWRRPSREPIQALARWANESLRLASWSLESW